MSEGEVRDGKGGEGGGIILRKRIRDSNFDTAVRSACGSSVVVRFFL